MLFNPTLSLIPYLIFFSIILYAESIPFTFTIANFTMTPEDPLPLRITPYNISYSIVEYIPAGLDMQLILPEPFTIPNDSKTVDYSGYPYNTMIESFKQDTQYIIDIKNNYAVPAGSTINLRVASFQNPAHNRYYNQTALLTFEDGPMQLFYNITFDMHFRLKNFATTPNLTMTRESITPGNSTVYSFSLNTSVPGFCESMFTFKFPYDLITQESSCILDPVTLPGAKCNFSSLNQVEIYIYQDLPAGVFDFSLSSVLNPTIVNTTEILNLSFTSYDWEGLIMEQTGLAYSFECDLGCEVCNATECLVCLSSFFLDQGACVKNCPFGSYPEVNMCRRDCVDGCLVCTGTNSNCSKCESQLSLYNFSCLTNCPVNYRNTDGICSLVEPSQITTSETTPFYSELGNVPVFSVYMGLCFLIWVWSGICCKDSMNVTSLLVLLSSLEPCLYIYLLITAILLEIFLLSALFAFLVTVKITLQALYVTNSLQNLSFCEIEENSNKSSFLQALEYAYNLKFGFLRDSKLFGKKSLLLTARSRKKMHSNLVGVLKSSAVFECMTIAGYIGYYITSGLDHEAPRLLYIESCAYLLLQVLVAVLQIYQIRKIEKKPVVEPGLSVRTTTSIHNNRSHILNDSTSQRLNPLEESKLELDRSRDISLDDIKIIKEEQHQNMTPAFGTAKEKVMKNRKDVNIEPYPGFGQGNLVDGDHWQEEGSIIAEPQILPENKEEQKRKSVSSSLKKKLQIMSDKVVKTLANFSSTKKKRKMVQLNDITAFVRSRSTEPDIMDKENENFNTTAFSKNRGQKYVVDSQLDVSLPGQTQEKWWSLGKEMSFGDLALQPSDLNQINIELNKDSYVKEAVLPRNQPRGVLHHNGKFVLFRFGKPKADKENQECEEVVLEK